MILRSVMKHVRDQNWVEVGLDLLIMVVEVFDWPTHGPKKSTGG